MNAIIKDVLRSIEDCGYMSYVVGGYVRDKMLLGFENYDVDIATNAPVEFLINLFKEYKPKEFLYGTIKFKINEYSFDISQFRDETYVNNKLIVKYTNNLLIDSRRRDFTINSIYQSSDGIFIDYHNGINDCTSKLIKFIGDPKVRIEEDPSRIYRLLYFSLKYGLKCNLADLKAIKDNGKFIIDLCPFELKRKYFNKILELNKYKELGLLLKELDLYTYFFRYETNIDYSSKMKYLLSSGFNHPDILKSSEQKEFSS